MNKLQLYRAIRHHISLSEKRNPMFEANRTSKIIIYVMTGFWALYLVGIAISIFFAVKGNSSITGYEMLGGLIPFIMPLDFLLRFVFQQTPAQQIKPYVLLPISKYTCINGFLFSSLFNGYNLFWFFFFLPYTFLAILFAEGFAAFAGALFGWWLLLLINSQWYLLMRTLVNDKMYWWSIAVVFYAAAFAPWYLGSGSSAFGHFMDLYATISTGFTFWNPITYLIILFVLAALILVNRRLQFIYSYRELAKVEQVKLKKVSEFNYLDKYGDIGQYLKLEIKSIMRNKTIRTRFIQSISIVIMFSVLLSYTDIYDNGFMTQFICVYNFAIFGAMFLSQIMGAEGNYIDGLMVHKDNVYSLLKAKYLLNCIMLVLPIILMIPTLVSGKTSILMILCYLFLTSGPIYFVFFQMAVYNKQSIPLNQKMIGKGNTNNFTQTLITFGAFFVPIILFYVLGILFKDTTVLLILMIIGIGFTITNSIWIRNIYKRMMLRRYENMDGFRNSR